MYMCDISSERKFFCLHDDVMCEYIHNLVKSQDGFKRANVEDTRIRISVAFLSLYKILKFLKILFFIYIIYNIMFKYSFEYKLIKQFQF